MSAVPKILLVEDDANIAAILRQNLRRDGYSLEIAADGGEGLSRALDGEFDLILLDVMLPVMDGFTVCRQIRRQSQVPIIFLTARTEETDRILGLDTGADDYILKPFSPKELLARIRANIRRSSVEAIHTKETVSAEKISLGELTIDSERYLVTKNGVPLELSQKDFDLLHLLAKTPGRVFSREELMQEIWRYDGGFYGDIRNVDVTVCRLRTKIEDDSAKPKILLTKRGAGYFVRKTDRDS